MNTENPGRAYPYPSPVQLPTGQSGRASIRRPETDAAIAARLPAALRKCWFVNDGDPPPIGDPVYTFDTEDGYRLLVIRVDCRCGNPSCSVKQSIFVRIQILGGTLAAESLQTLDPLRAPAIAQAQCRTRAAELLGIPRALFQRCTITADGRSLHLFAAADQVPAAAFAEEGATHVDA